MWKFEEYITCGAMQRELNCVCLRCGAACGQGLRTWRSMRMYFLLSTPSLVPIALRNLAPTRRRKALLVLAGSRCINSL